MRGHEQEEMRAIARHAHGNWGFGLRVVLWEAQERRSRRRRCAAIRFDAASEPLGEVVCKSPPATAVIVQGFLAQSSYLEPEAVCEANEIFSRPAAVVLKSRVRFCSGAHSRAKHRCRGGKG
jgi:hypothetical protein